MNGLVKGIFKFWLFKKGSQALMNLISKHKDEKQHKGYKVIKPAGH